MRMQNNCSKYLRTEIRLLEIQIGNACIKICTFYQFSVGKYAVCANYMYKCIFVFRRFWRDDVRQDKAEENRNGSEEHIADQGKLVNVLL